MGSPDLARGLLRPGARRDTPGDAGRAEAAARPVPAIDLEVPDVIETATFALG